MNTEHNTELTQLEAEVARLNAELDAVIPYFDPDRYIAERMARVPHLSPIDQRIFATRELISALHGLISLRQRNPDAWRKMLNWD